MATKVAARMMMLMTRVRLNPPRPTGTWSPMGSPMRMPASSATGSSDHEGRSAATTGSGIQNATVSSMTSSAASSTSKSSSNSSTSFTSAHPIGFSPVAPSRPGVNHPIEKLCGRVDSSTPASEATESSESVTRPGRRNASPVRCAGQQQPSCVLTNRSSLNCHVKKSTKSWENDTDTIVETCAGVEVHIIRKSTYKHFFSKNSSCNIANLYNTLPVWKYNIVVDKRFNPYKMAQVIY